MPCGAELVLAALLVALLAMSQVATRAVDAVKAMAVLRRVISLAVYKGEMGRVRFVSSSISLRSLSSQRRFRIFFAGGGTNGDDSWTALGGDVGRCERVDDVYVEASVWVLDIQTAGLL